MSLQTRHGFCVVPGYSPIISAGSKYNVLLYTVYITIPGYDIGATRNTPYGIPILKYADYI